MALTETQIAFLETYIFRRRLTGTDVPQGHGSGLPETEAQRRQKASEILGHAASLPTPAEATAAERAALERHRGAISASTDDPPTGAGLVAAAREVKAMGETHAAIEARIARDREARAQRKLDLSGQLGSLGALDDAEATEAERKALAAAREAAGRALAGDPPSGDALDRAADALAAARGVLADAALRIAADRKERADLRAALLLRVGAATLAPKATTAETDRRKDEADAIALLLAPEAPARAVLGDAGKLVVALEDFAKATNADLARRAERFAAAEKLRERIEAMDRSLPDACPKERAEALATRHADLGKALAPFLDWDRVTAWAAEALGPVAGAIDPLAKDFADLRRKVTEAVEALRLAREAAADAIGKPAGTSFSAVQAKALGAELAAAVAAAETDILAAGPHLAALRALAGKAAALARLRVGLRRRIDAVKAPAGAARPETERWTRLKAAAEAAIDEVLEP